MCSNIFEPFVMKILEIRSELDSVKTFVIDNSDHKIQHLPGQFALITPVFGHGEIVISICSSPTQKDTLEFSIKNAGLVTDIMHRMDVGDDIMIRGPYGSSFPMKDLENHNLIFIGGGIGIAPLRSVIDTVFAEREKFKSVHILYGARSAEEIIYKKMLTETWPSNSDTFVECTVDKGDDSWKGRVGFVPSLLDEVTLPIENSKVLTCGPPIMIKFILDKLKKLGYKSENIITTLEMNMKCGVGKCGRCNIGSKYICIDGPVFTLKELENLPNEY